MNQQKPEYFKHLDGVRTIAVLMVVVHHWYKGSFHYLHYGGAMGVGLFFVLSGFLITNILLKQQLAFQSGNWKTKLLILKVFYIRRTLRIFPIYYLYVLVLVIFGVGQAREIWPWLFGYAYNFLLFFTNNWFSGEVEHLWSLAIEEQYYLVWPALLLFCPPKWNLHLVVIFIGSAIITKGLLYLNEPASQFSKFPVCQFDGFGFGSLLALAWQRKIKIPYPAFFFCFFWGLSFFMKWNVLHFHGKSFLGQTLPFYFIGCAFLIYMAAKGIEGPFSYFFNNSIVIFLGKISYGLYLYHLFVPGAIYSIFKYFHIQFFPSPFMWFIYSSVTLGICLFSWFRIELPINRWKDKFKYIPSL
jgi:peptidoglycan/LPS O-acetylase OafA/YrhL